jgi:hypothetical protein
MRVPSLALMRVPSQVPRSLVLVLVLRSLALSRGGAHVRW